jgi:hypothetical protein
MSTPAGLPVVDEGEMQRWFVWLIERGYSEVTARNWISRLRSACAYQVNDPEEVDEIPGTTDSRAIMRQALREYNRFREAGG